MRSWSRVVSLAGVLVFSGAAAAGCCIEDGSQCSPVDDEACCSERCGRPTIYDNYRCLPSSLTTEGQARLGEARQGPGRRLCLPRLLRRL